jgi:hypothetical protein
MTEPHLQYKILPYTEATSFVPECQVKCDWDGMWDGKRGFWLVCPVPPFHLEWHSNDWRCQLCSFWLSRGYNGPQLCVLHKHTLLTGRRLQQRQKSPTRWKSELMQHQFSSIGFWIVLSAAGKIRQILFGPGNHDQKTSLKSSHLNTALIFRLVIFIRNVCKVWLVPGSIDKKGGRRFHLSSIFCLIKDGTLFPLRCLMNPALVA